MSCCRLVSRYDGLDQRNGSGVREGGWLRLQKLVIAAVMDRTAGVIATMRSVERVALLDMDINGAVSLSVKFRELSR